MNINLQKAPHEASMESKDWLEEPDNKMKW